MRTNRPARLRTFSYVGIHRYSLTFCTDRRSKPFGYEHVLRTNEKAVIAARYILQNPVRAGLARTVLEYPFVGSQTCDIKELIDGLGETSNRLE